MTPEQELEKLIREQARELRRGPRVERQPMTVALTEKMAEYHLGNQGEKHDTGRRFVPAECSIHGRDEIRPPCPSDAARGKRFRCNACSRENRKRWLQKGENRVEVNRRRAELDKKRRETEPEWKKEERRQYRERLLADTERHEAHKAKRREYYANSEKAKASKREYGRKWRQRLAR